ncbi:MAG: Gfo/Idh/MocA family oxidoreductase [Eubacterium sp.]|jgi:predicted dehydrogenase|nr:Gfo/Idh/MocA family oxidoreductase [Eubacterium sp.]
MVGIAIIGTGGISKKHIAAALNFPKRCEIRALCNRDTTKAEKLCGEFNLSAEIFSDYTKLIGDPSIGLAIVCTPPASHAQITLDFFKNGRHVLVEKPMALTLEEAGRMLSAGRDGGPVFSVVSQNRFISGYAKLKSIVDSGLLGRIKFAQVNSYWWRGKSYHSLPWRGMYKSEGGGVTTSQAIHHIDLLLWIMGMPNKVTSTVKNFGHPDAEVEDLSVAIFEYDDAVAVFTASQLHHGSRSLIELQGEHASISWPFCVNANIEKPDGFPIENKKLKSEIESFYDSLKDIEYEPFTAQLDDVLTAIETEGQPLVSATDGYRAMELIGKIYRTAGIAIANR